LTGINTAPLGSSNAFQAFQNGEFGLDGNSGQIATTETEPASNPAGASGTRATAGMGDAFTSSFMAVPFANGNATVSLQRLVGKVVVPNPHASAAGSTRGGPGRGISTSSAGSDAFSDLVSIMEAQIDAVDKQIGSNLGAIWVKLSYLVSGAVAAKNGSAGADFFV